MRQWLDRARNFGRLDRREQRTVCLAWVLLPLVSFSIKWAGLKSTTRWLTRWSGARPRAAAPPADFPDVAARSVKVAAAHQPIPTLCLTQSVTLWFLLARQGIDSAVRIGVTKDAGVFGAHAWVDLNGTVLLDRPDVTDRFRTIR